MSEQASHNGDLAHAVEGGLVDRGADSTGLAIQDLAVALAATEGADTLGLPALEL